VICLRQPETSRIAVVYGARPALRAWSGEWQRAGLDRALDARRQEHIQNDDLGAAETQRPPAGARRARAPPRSMAARPAAYTITMPTMDATIRHLGTLTMTVWL